MSRSVYSNFWPYLVSGFFPCNLYAEPVVSLGHLPWLWGLSLLLAALCAWLIWHLTAGMQVFASPTKRCLASLTIALIFLIFISPIIVALGSILITGRTM